MVMISCINILGCDRVLASRTASSNGASVSTDSTSFAWSSVFFSILRELHLIERGQGNNGQRSASSEDVSILGDMIDLMIIIKVNNETVNKWDSY